MNSINFGQSQPLENSSILLAAKTCTDLVTHPLRRIYTLYQVDRLFSSRTVFYNIEKSKVNLNFLIYSRQKISGFWKGFSLSIFEFMSFIKLGQGLFSSIHASRKRKHDYASFEFTAKARDDSAKSPLEPMSKSTELALFWGFFNMFHFCFYPLKKLQMSMMLDLTNFVDKSYG